MATIVEHYVTSAGAGSHNGTSVANAYTMAEALAACNALGALAANHYFYLCGSVGILASLAITKAGNDDYRIFWLGRNEDGTADSEITVDAGGGSFAIWNVNIATSAFHVFKNIHAYNTSGVSGYNGWTTASGANKITLVNCSASYCYNGIDLSSAGTGCKLARCYAHNNRNIGLNASSSNAQQAHECSAYDNVSHGFSGFKMGIHRCMSYRNGGAGYNACGMLIDSSLAHANTSHGFNYSTANMGYLRGCIATNNGGYGVLVGSQGYCRAYRFATFENALGRNSTTSGGDFFDHSEAQHTLTANPYVAGDLGNFELNDDAGGGSECRNTDGILLPGTSTYSYHDIGPAQKLGVDSSSMRPFSGVIIDRGMS